MADETVVNVVSCVNVVQSTVLTTKTREYCVFALIDGAHYMVAGPFTIKQDAELVARGWRTVRGWIAR